MIKAQIIKHSSSKNADDLITILCHSPKQFDAQLEKHRMISSNSSSDRAKPSNKMLKENPFIPEIVYKNEPGMQGKEILTKEEYITLETDLVQHYEDASCLLDKHKHVHKQTINRYILPFSWQDKVMTATLTEWKAFFKHRLDDNIVPPGPCAAQPEIQELAYCIFEGIQNSNPVHLDVGEWHLPFVTDSEIMKYSNHQCLIMSSARCARTSYSNHDKSNPTLEGDIKTYNFLIESDPSHPTPLEHQATPLSNSKISCFNIGQTIVPKGITHITLDGSLWSANFKGWIQHRKVREAE